MTTQTLQNTSMQELAECFNLAFSDYQVPLQVEAEPFAKSLHERGVVMELSAGAFDGERLVGFVLTGLDTIQEVTTAYNAGTGVVPAYRGRQLTRQLYDFIMPMLRARNIRECLLEVITENTRALKVYEELGYVRNRVLKCYKGMLSTRLQKEGIDVRALAEMNSERWQSYWAWRPSWQHGMMTVSRSLAGLVILGAYIQEKLAGYLIYHPAQKRVYQFAVDKTHRRRGVGTALFQYLAEHFTGELSVLNVDDDAAETEAFLLSLGLQHYASQFEMKLCLAEHKN